MAKQLNIDVNLNTAKATQQLQALQQALTQAIQGAAGGNRGALTREIVQATEAAVRLKTMLSQAMNTNTGNLDLSKFSQQLARNSTSLQAYARQLTALGPQGEKAFMQMSKAIVSAETPMRQSNKLMNSLWTTMKNTARWQLSSAALHTFIGGIKNAFSYARGLNDSLNSIRIVTGQSAEQMDAFAQRANKSAKELSASTLDYTDAALIYYQQGIRDQQQIKERTDATIKMAKVTGQSASNVSEQMTAIWNNFADGSKNLEYYADVITALGANTASSSKEIAAGLEKFAAVADTVGLSYEYATSALATVVATTRQSADVVGTAFKTLFARIQDLDLGKTLDDGTTLGKYSAALDAVGISIKNQNGELRNMDDILDDMGTKWDTLNKDQQVALAQTVAGTRQYTQLVALMDNWDFMKENLMVAKGSEGELQKQADIYAESWKAAKERVKASAQAIYSDLIDDDFFIGLNNTLATALSGLDKFIDAIGGIPGVLGLVGIALTTVFKDQFGRVIETNIQRLKVMSGIATQEANALRGQAMQAASQFTPQNTERSLLMESNAMRTQLELANALQEKKQQIAATGGRIAESDLQQVEAMMEMVDMYDQMAISAQKAAEAAQQQFETNQLAIGAQIAQNTRVNYRGRNPDVRQALISEQADANRLRVGELNTQAEALGRIQGALESVRESGTLTGETIRLLGESFNQAFNPLGRTIQQVQEEIAAADGGIENTIRIIREARQEIEWLQRARNNTNGARVDERVAGLRESIRNNEASLERQQANVQNKYREQAQIRMANNLTARATDIAQMFQNAGTDEAAQAAANRAAQAFTRELQQRLGYTGNNNVVNQALMRLFQSVNPRELGVSAKAFNDMLISAFQNGKLEIPPTAIDTSGLRARTLAEIEALGVEAKNKLSTSIMGAFNGLSSFAMGLSSLNSAIKALNNQDLSFFEKFTQVSMSLGIGIPMLVSGLAKLTTNIGAVAGGFNTLTMSMATNAVASSLVTKGMAQETAAYAAQQIAYGSSLKNIGLLIAAKFGLIETTGFTASVTDLEAAAALREAGYEGFEAEMVGVNTAAHIGLVSAKEALLRVQAKLLAFAGKWLLPIAAIMGAVMAWKAASKVAEESTLDFKLKEAQSEAKNLQSDLEQTKTAAENLASAFDKYNSARDALDNCAEGTKEWTDALIEANQAALDLISNYPDLAKIPGAITHDANGAISISKEAQAQVLADAQKNVITLQNATIEANKSVSDIQHTIDKKDWANSLRDLKWKDESGKEYLDQTLTQYTKGSLTDAGNILANNADQLIGLSGEALGSKMEEILSGKGITIDGDAWANILESSGAIDGLYELGTAAQAAADAQKAQREVMAKQNLEANSSTKGLKNKDEIATILARGQEKDYKETATYLAGQYEAKLNSVFTDDKIAMAKDAVDILGGSMASTYWDKKDKVYKYEDASGSEKTLTKEEIASILASRDVQQKQTDIAPRLDNLINTLNRQSESGNVKAGAAKEFMVQGDLSNVSKKQVLSLVKALETGEKISLDDLIDINEADAQALGFKTKAAFEEALTTDAIETDKLFKTNLDGIDKIAKSHVNSIQRATNDALSLSTEKQLGNQFDQLANGANGKTAMANYQNMLKSMASQLPEDQYDSFFKAISNIDFSKTTHAFEALDNVCQKFGINLSGSGPAISRFNSLIANATGQIISMKSAMEGLTDIIAQLKDLNIGDIVDEDFYNNLISQYPQLAQFFTENAEGQHILWGDAEKMASRATREAGELMSKGYELGKILQEADLLSAETTMSKTNDQGRTKTENASLLDVKQMNDNEVLNLWEQLKDNEGVDNLLNALGYTQDAIDALGDNADDTRTALERMFDAYQEYGNADLDQLKSQAGEQLANGATSIEDLNSMMGYGSLQPDQAVTSDIDGQSNLVVGQDMGSWTPMIDDSAYSNTVLKMIAETNDLGEAMNILDKSMIDLSQTAPAALADSLINLGEGYETLQDEIQQVNVALNSGDDSAIAMAVDDLQRAEEVIAVAESLGETAEAADDAVDRFGELNDELAQNEGMLKSDSEAATDAAKRFLQMNNAIDSISNNLKKYNNVLENAKDSTVDAHTPLSTLGKDAVNLQKDVANLIGTNQKLVKANTLAKISYEDLQGAAEGNIDSINNVRKAFAQGLAEEYGQLGDLTNVANQFADAIEALPEGAAIDIDTQPFLTHLAQAMMAAGATADDIEAAFAGLNIDCDITPFYGTLEEAREIARQTGDSFIESLGVDAEGRTQIATNTGQEENVGFREQLFIYNKTATATVLEQDATTPTTVTLSYPEVHKQVAAIPMIEQTTEEKPITGVFVKNAHKSAGGKVGANSSRGGGGGGGCFVAGTLISTINGYENIENISIGEIVLSYNEQTKQNEYKQVNRTMIHKVYEKIYTLYIENEIIEVTGIHPFYIKRNNKEEWLEVKDINKKDLVLFANGTWHKIDKILIETKFETVYNFEVEDNHNYYISASQILVHNKGGGRRCFVPKTLVAMQGCQTFIEDILPGDMVLSYNEESKKNEYNEVLSIMSHRVIEEIYTIYIENEIIQVTGTHPFYIIRRNSAKWREVSTLKSGDQVLYANGEVHVINKIDIEIKDTLVYNLEVANNHNYYVGVNKVLVHNKGGGGRGRAARTAAVAAVNPRKESTGQMKDLEHSQKKTQIAAEKLSKTIDRVYGKRRVNMMQDLIKLQGKELDQIKELNKLREKEYKDSIERLKKAKEIEVQYTETIDENAKNIKESIEFWSHYGLEDKIKYDEQGFIANLGELERLAAEKHNEIIEKYNGVAETDETKNVLARENAIYSAFKDLTGETESFWEAWQNGLTEWEDKLYEIHDQFAEMLKYKLEVRLDLIEGDLKIINTKLKSIGDSIYKAAEALTLLWESDPNKRSQFDSIIEAGQTYQTHWKEINEHFDPEKWQELDQLTQEAYIEQSQTIRDGLLEQAEALIDLRDAYEDYYQDTLSKATAEIEKYTKAMEHNANILDHLKNLLDLTGREFDYDAKDALIRGKMSINKDQYDAAADWAQRQKAQVEAARAEYEELKAYDPLGAENFKREVLDPSVEYFHEAEEKMYAAAEELASNINDLWENTVAKIKDEFEKAVTGGDGFDYLTERMERAKAIQEEYLTTTNKLYETNTLMRKVQKDIDKTDNNLRKEKLASFNKEIEQAQKSHRLAQSEMEILKARYEILQAEMALEDAKDAKAIVRLQRDSEGNYGYVYTADQDKVDDAEQNLADKQNDLYNLVLNYQNEYQEKRLQAQREYEEARDKIWEDWYNKRISDEERDERLGELRAHFLDKMQAYEITINESNKWLNIVAAEGVTEAWTNSDKDRIASTEEFLAHDKEANQRYQQIAQETNNMRAEITEDTKLGLDDVKGKTEELTTANEELANELRNDVIPKVDAEISKVREATAAFEHHATAIQRTIDEYLQLSEAIQKVLRELVGEMDEPADYSMQMFDEMELTGSVSQTTMDKRSAKVKNNNMTRAQYGTNNPETVLAAEAWYEDNRGLSKSEYLKAYREGTLPASSKDTELQRMADMVSSRLPGKTDNSGNDDIMDFLETKGYQFEGMGRTYDNITQNTTHSTGSAAKKAIEAANEAAKAAGISETNKSLNNETDYSGRSASQAAKEAVYEANSEVYNKLFEQVNTNFSSWVQGLSSVIQATGESISQAVSAFKTVSSEPLEQNVHVTAEFPNVTSSDQILEAFGELPNMATQYANKT